MTDIVERLWKLEAAAEIERLRAALADAPMGGGCYACEPLGELNAKQATEIEWLRAREKDLTLDGLGLIGRIEQTRDALAGTDAASLPRDYPLERMAQDRMAEIERLRAALREIEGIIPHATPDYSHRVWAIARAALGGE